MSAVKELPESKLEPLAPFPVEDDTDKSGGLDALLLK